MNDYFDSIILPHLNMKNKEKVLVFSAPNRFFFFLRHDNFFILLCSDSTPHSKQASGYDAPTNHGKRKAFDVSFNSKLF